ncbi:hypothetical protein ACFQGX_09150 [Nonomuraea dietziae]|uniref:hypothetical protein n=1 Tax=Nonomuraea dietziae TaxID=65515 RepID=UPI00361D73FD
MATRLRCLDWIEVAEHQRYSPLRSTKKTLPRVLGRLTFFTLPPVLAAPVGATMPGLPSSGWSALTLTSLVTSLESQWYCVAFLSAAPLAFSQNLAVL